MSSLPIQTRDNSEWHLLEEELCHLDTLQKLAEPTISELSLEDRPNLLIFPQDLDVYGDKIGDAHIFEVKGDKIATGNIMGYIGCGSTKVSISSRFAQNKDDYFLHYMLRKVFAVNLFDLQFNSDEESIFDLLIYLFPAFLKRAMQQGLYREYQTREYNDANAKGRIDISRHIRRNIPFAGSIAYTTREYAQDNHLTQLIRHTIEYIREKDFGTSILSSDEDMKDSVAAVISATPTYSKSARLNTIIKNLRSRVHPYYSEYEPLRQLCLQILRQEGIKYGEENDKVYGVIFDGAWLWEAYLNTVLVKEGFHHPENRLGTDGIYMFADPEDDDEYDKYSKIMYPDFYRKNHILDAKYKHLNQGVGKEDLYQVITYMYCTQSEHGTYVYPFEKNVPNSKYRLNGYGGTIMVYPFYVPQFTGDWKVFNKEILESEELLRIELGKSKLVKDENC